MISIVCVYNDKEILDNFLLKSLKNQSAEYELILMDNTTGKFKSAAEALNKGGNKAKGEYIMFVHQDIDLESDGCLKNIENISNRLNNLGIAGAAGRTNYKPQTITNIKDGIPPKSVSPETFNEPVKVQTLDECLVIIPKNVFKKIKFDEKVCNDWHLYAVDYSLSVKKLGLNAYVIPLFAYHRSKAYSLSEKYYETLKKVLSKHKTNKVIFTTVEDWLTFFPLILQRKMPGLKNKIIFSIISS